MMNQPQIAEGELLAYLDGEHLPHVEQALHASPELQRELEALRQIDAWAKAQFGGIDRPDPQDLVDVVTGQATDQQRLIVAAYERKSVRGRRELAALRKEFAALQRQPKSSLIPWPKFVATLLLPSVATRTRRDQGKQQGFQVEDLQAQITIRKTPLVRELGGIEGYVTQNLQPVANAKVTLRAAHIRSRSCTTDEAGLFTFGRLIEGVYEIQIYLSDGLVIIPDIELKD